VDGVTYHTLARRPVPWLCDGRGPQEIAISSRIRLARNLDAYPFPGRASPKARQEVLGIVQEVATRLDSMRPAVCGDMAEMGEVDRSLLLERRLVSKELCGRGAGSGFVYRADESVSVMINEEDHIRVQVLLPHLQLGEAWRVAVVLDRALGALVRFAFEPRLGFLTACPTNVGTGLRASVMLHLPALVLSGQIQAMAQAARKLRFGVRGMLGEGTEAVANLFQISNQSTLGESEDQILRRLDVMIDRFVAEEQNARLRLARLERVRLCDHVARAHAVLRESYILSSKEALNSLSAVRFGVEMGMLSRLTQATVNRLSLAVLPGHLQVERGSPLDVPDRDVARAELVRAELRAAEA